MFSLMIVSVFVFVLVGGLIAGLIMWSTSGSGTATKEMACGSCGYAVKGLTQLNCPECGVDLREAGIRQTSSPGKRQAGMILTFACGGLLLVGCGMSSFLFIGKSSVQTVPASRAVPLQPLAQPVTPGTQQSNTPQPTPSAPPTNGSSEGESDNDQTP